MSDRPNVTVIFQESKPATAAWTCSEVALSLFVLGGLAWAITGAGLFTLLGELLGIVLEILF